MDIYELKVGDLFREVDVIYEVMEVNQTVRGYPWPVVIAKDVETGGMVMFGYDKEYGQAYKPRIYNMEDF